MNKILVAFLFMVFANSALGQKVSLDCATETADPTRLDWKTDRTYEIDIDMDAGTGTVPQLTSSMFFVTSTDVDSKLSITNEFVRFGDSALAGRWYLAINRETLAISGVLNSRVRMVILAIRGECELVERETSNNKF